MTKSCEWDVQQSCERTPFFLQREHEQKRQYEARVREHTTGNWTRHWLEVPLSRQNVGRHLVGLFVTESDKNCARK